jgi:polyphosphate kinase 2 (PPK2 family)
MAKASKQRPAPIGDLLRAPRGTVDLGAIDTRSTPGFDGKKAAAKALQPALAERIAALQEQLYAEGRSGGSRSVLLVLQGMDTSGKGGTVGHVVGQVDPAGVHVVAFRSPTREELSHEFLWRIRRELPEPGMLAVFDRSHYEDVVAVRVRKLVERRTWARRYATINRFEEQLAASGTLVVKCFLHISPEEQRERLLRASTTLPSTGSTAPATSRTASCGARSWRHTATRSSAATATRRPGTWCRPTASGTATGRSATC